jgi:hypothetical protein
MKIAGVLVDMPVELNPESHGPCVVHEKTRKVLCVQALRAICGMSQAALPWHKKFRTEFEAEGLKFNPHDPCVANHQRKGLQHALLFHVNDLKSSNKDSRVNDEFKTWLAA